jgi:hypothetical protein
VPVANGDAYGVTDGLLKPAPATFESCSVDLGYGFLVSGRDYVVTVPYDTQAVKLQPHRFATGPQNNENGLDVEVASDSGHSEIVQAADYQSDQACHEDFIATGEIPLNAEGDTVITLTTRYNDITKKTDGDFYADQNFYTRDGGIKYTVTVVREEKPAAVVFSMPSNTKLSVKNTFGNKTIQPDTAGGAGYALGAGTYALSFTSPYYEPKTSTLTVAMGDDGYEVTFDGDVITPENEEFTVDISSSLVPVADHSGENVAVRIVGYDSIVVETTVQIPAVGDIPDLTCYVNKFNPSGAFHYVRTNFGGYTALHAVIDTLLNADIRFSCANGKLMPGLVFSKNGHGSDKGWLCRVDNDIYTPAEARLSGGETVTFYYNAALAGHQYVWFSESSAEVARNRTVSLTLNGAPVSESGVPAPITGATICIDGEAWPHVTESDGSYTLTELYDVPLGQHIVTATIDNGSGVNLLTYTQVKLTVKASENGGSPGEMTQGNALDAVYAAFDAVVNRAYGKASFEAIRAARDAGIIAISNASSGFDALAASTIAAINAEAAKYSVEKALAALVPNPDGYVTVSIEDWGIRLPESGLDYPTPLGILIPATRVPYVSGDTMGDVTLRLLNALGIKATHSYNSQHGSMYLESIGEFYMPTGEYVEIFGEFSSGSGSGWMVSLNGWFMNMGVSYFEVENGDVIRWQNTCQIGSDIGANNKTAKMLGLVFKANPGRLSPAFNDGVKQFIYTIPKSVTSIRMAARPESGMAEVTYTSGGVQYLPMEEIPVSNGTVIEIACRYKGSGDAVLDERRLTVTIQVEGDAIVKPGGVAGETTKLTPKVIAVNGTASITLSVSDLSTAITDIKDNGSGAIVIEPEITGAAKKVTVELPKASLSSIATDTDTDLTVETPVGRMTIPNDVLASIASQATGNTVTMSLEAVDASTLTAAQRATVGDDKVYDISILSNGTHISSFGGGSVTISLPYTLKPEEKPANVSIWYLDDSGKLRQMTCTYDEMTGLATFTTDHLSYYIVGYEEWVNPFSDVKSTDWFYNAVKYVSRNTLMSGSSATAFEPNTDMTRAMLVTVLYRLEGKPVVTAKNTFTDVKSGQWYTEAIIWANANNIAGGYGGGLFGTNDSVTREQMAAILMNYAKYKKYDVTKTTDLKSYSDAKAVDSWASDAIKWTVAEGLITGTTATTLSPKDTASRAQVATILMRLIENVSK